MLETEIVKNTPTCLQIKDCRCSIVEFSVSDQYEIKIVVESQEDDGTMSIPRIRNPIVLDGLIRWLKNAKRGVADEQ